DCAYVASPRAVDGDAADAGAGPAQQLWADRRHGRVDGEPGAHDLCVWEFGRVVARRRETIVAGTGREAREREAGLRAVVSFFRPVGSSGPLRTACGVGCNLTSLRGFIAATRGPESNYLIVKARVSSVFCSTS